MSLDATPEEVEAIAKAIEAGELFSASECEKAANMLRALRRRVEEAEAQAAAAWEAGRDAALRSIAALPTPMIEDIMHGHEDAYRAVEALTPPADASAALQAVKDAEWNAAIEAAANQAEDCCEYGSPPEKYAPRIRALSRNAILRAYKQVQANG